MTPDSAAELTRRLRALGVSQTAIDAAWPRWWSGQAESSPSARAELAFGIARRLGLEPDSLLHENDHPRFRFRAETRFKHLSSETEEERNGIASFGHAIASLLLAAAPMPEFDLSSWSAGDLRARLIQSRPFVALGDLLTACWAAGIPVAHLRIFPWQQKRMAAMTIGIDGRGAILLGKDSRYPAPIAFYLGHELGHYALGHTSGGASVVDMGTEVTPSEGDNEEREADRYALELLTGVPTPEVLPDRKENVSGRSLAKAAQDRGPGLGIEPGMLAQCFGYSTGDWATANAALRYIYPQSSPVWEAVNGIAWAQLDEAAIPEDADSFLRSVLGTPSPHSR